MRLPNDRVATLINELEKIDFLDTPEHCCDCPDEPVNSRACQFLIDYRPGGVEKERSSSTSVATACSGAIPQAREPDRPPDGHRTGRRAPPVAGRIHPARRQAHGLEDGRVGQP